MTPARLLLLLLLPAAACGSPPAASDPLDWKAKVREVRLDWDRVRLEEWLARNRSRDLRLPLQAGGGSFRRGIGPSTEYDRFPLDEAFDLFVVWNDRSRKGLRSAEVVGLPDLSSRIPAEFLEVAAKLNRCPSGLNVWDFNSVQVLRAVNALHGLGDRARPALKAYHGLCRSASWEERIRYGLEEFRILPVIQLLYVREGGMPPFALGGSPLVPPQKDAWPLFPMILEKDNPFIVVTGYFSTGPGSNAMEHLEAGDVVRPAPLAPSVDPVQAVEELTFSPRWEALINATDDHHPKQTREGAQSLLWLVRREALHAIDHLYTPPPPEDPADCCKDPSEVAWRRIVDEVRALGIRWDASRQDFVRSR